MNYSELSDFEINKLVAEAVGLSVDAEQYESYGDRDERVVLVAAKDGYGSAVDYCNNPSDAWPIIESSKIDFEWLSVTAEASDISGKRHCEDANCLRACMIVFLMIKEGSDNE